MEENKIIAYKGFDENLCCRGFQYEIGKEYAHEGEIECFSRIDYWHKRLIEYRNNHVGAAIYAYAQPFRYPYRPNSIIPQWQKDMAAWCNKRMIFTTVDFKDFEPRKGFKCGQYFDMDCLKD